mmetsp:Transcript_48810/g.56258  ORF Transcript_48810/g.56258 Transcript_48810/m.56258 type:complete len:113 (-) Transcript_48810:67-405(-)|eukprot:CAMPEP_0176451782 /NCGR_PEP_ID=MMETSP0127-20121128/28086_1 /TAXON_ID=938130 /ORGANISM="Platyophrya macrostoma, Strain WH" /LENGTH=112 /DNA_ID=CAMNT_0017839993 /DNA_START=41 /DNA_END=379 /DNA_ORIENTATION=+
MQARTTSTFTIENKSGLMIAVEVRDLFGKKIADFFVGKDTQETKRVPVTQYKVEFVTQQGFTCFDVNDERGIGYTLSYNKLGAFVKEGAVDGVITAKPYAKRPAVCTPFRIY